MPKYWDVYTELKDFYFKVRYLPCPAIHGRTIIFDQRGFNHMLRKGNHKRSISEQIRRFRLFFKIKTYIKIASLEQFDGNYYVLRASDGSKNVKIIIALIHKSNILVFISIMNT